MTIELRLPDMGEGIDDVTINRWLKSEGDGVEVGDVVLEVATDKIDTDVMATASGVLLKQNFGEGELVDVDAVFAYIGEAGESVPSSAAPSDIVESPPEDVAEDVVGDTTREEPAKVTPVAERMMAEHGIRPDEIAGGDDGKITKQDVQDFMAGDTANHPPSQVAALPDELANIPSYVVQRTAASAAASREAGERVTIQPRFVAPQNDSVEAPQPVPSAPARAPSATQEELIKPTRMRQLIARNTHESLQSSPQLTTWHDVDMTAVLQHRKAHKKSFAAEGINLTVTAYLVSATVAGLKAVPAANGKWTDEGILIKRNYHIGMAVALPVDEYGLGGLIVPVIRDVGDLNLQGIARQVNQWGDKARANALTGADLQGGTFTLTNYGTSGSRFQTPIIHDNQAGMRRIWAIIWCSSP